VQVVCPDKAGEHCSMREHVNAAFTELLKKEGKLETLVFLFSGHHNDRGYMLGHKEEYITHDEFQAHLNKFKDFVKKIVVFLDCCSGRTFQDCDGKVIYVQLNACGSSERAIMEDVHGSIVTRFISQAFTREARDVPCILENHPKCSIPGNFITITSLHKYVEDHVNDYFKEKNCSYKALPELSVNKAKFNDTVVAYKYSYKVELKVHVAGDKPEMLTVKPEEYINVDQLKSLLLKKLLSKFIIFT